MKYRDNKKLQKDQYYHVFNRGNNKQLTFLDEQDFYGFIKRLKTVLNLPTGSPLKTLKPLPEGAFTIHSYCLMPNHFHLLIRQNTDIPISKLILKVCTSYCSYFNKKYNRVGHVFQDEYKAKLIENDIYFTYLTAYIHNNPLNPVEYQYSSLAEILGIRKDDLCDKKFLLGMFRNNTENYKQFVLNFPKTQEKEIDELL